MSALSHRDARRFHATTNALRDAIAAIPPKDRPAAIQSTARRFSLQALAISAIGISGWVLAALLIWSSRS